MTQFVLSYFDFDGGRGEDCRLALHLAGADWQDNRVRGADWPAQKPETPFGGLPVLEIAGKGRIAQSNAILGYLGRCFGLHPADAFEAAHHEALMNAVEDLRALITPTLQMKDPEPRRAAREALAKGGIPTWGKRIDRMLGDGPFVAGDEIHVADLKLFVVYKWFASGGLDHVPSDVLAPCKKLTRIYESVAKHPAVVEYYAARATN